MRRTPSPSTAPAPPSRTRSTPSGRTGIEKTTGVKLNYQSIGSGGGIAQIKAGTVDFGASDAPLKLEELKAAGLVQFPMIVGGVVPIVNVKGVGPGKLVLSGQVLAEIFLGNIKNWNDPKIAALNPGLSLPSEPIYVVHRSDGSGTTWIFTNYLAAVSPAWSSQVGADKAVSWPAGVGGKGSEGVSLFVQQTEGAISYVEYAYAIENKIAHANMVNRDGKTVPPTIDTFKAAVGNADWKNAPGYYVVLVNEPGADSWPIAGASFILVHKSQADAATVKAMFEFFDWSYKHGAEMASEIYYVPLPENVYNLVEATWADQVSVGGIPVWTAR